MVRPVQKGSTDQSVVIRIVDATDGTPETGVEHNTSGIDLWYRREGATKTGIVEAALAALDSAHGDGGIEHIGDGYYRLDLPDAAFAGGANGVMIGGTVTGMVVIGCYVPLVDYDPYDAVRLGLTALPNAAADAAGGLPISDAGGLDLDTLDSNVSAILTDTGEIGVASAGLTDINLPDQTMNITGNITGNLSGSVGSVTGNVGGNLAGSVGALATQAKSDVNAEVVDALATDTYGEPGQGAPGATISLAAKINYLFKAWRNKSDQTSSTYRLYNDAGSAVDQKASVADNGTTATKGEVVAGP